MISVSGCLEKTTESHKVGTVARWRLLGLALKVPNEPTQAGTPIRPNTLDDRHFA